jgi:hypothetical protein
VFGLCIGLLQGVAHGAHAFTGNLLTVLLLLSPLNHAADTVAACVLRVQEPACICIFTDSLYSQLDMDQTPAHVTPTHDVCGMSSPLPATSAVVLPYLQRAYHYGW